MEKLIDIYLSTKRMHILTHLLYLLMCALITNKTMNYFGYYYTYPIDINLATGLSFILSGQVILPLIMFVLISTFLHLFKEGAYFLFYMSRIRKKMFLDTIDFVKEFGKKLKWFDFKNGVYVRGVNFIVFERLIEDFREDKEGNMVDLASVVNTMSLSIIIVLPMYNFSISIKSTLIIASILYYLFNTSNLFLLYKIQELLDDFIKLKDNISQQTT